jgi:hypothetical protein
LMSKRGQRSRGDNIRRRRGWGQGRKSRLTVDPAPLASKLDLGLGEVPHLGVLREIGDQEVEQEATRNRHDAADDVEPPPTREAVQSVEVAVDRGLEVAREGRASGAGDEP